MSSMASKAIKVIKTEGIDRLIEKSLLKLIEAMTFNRRKAQAKFKRPIWREIDFATLDIKNAEARMLLNPVDEGFSKEFYCYGFREPLNTYFMSKVVEKRKPVVLDIGSNLGYFPLIELHAGAKHVVAVEPVPLTFSLLSRTLKEYRNKTLLNLAISDKNETLRLYIPKHFNIACPLKHAVLGAGLDIVEEISIKAVPMSTIAEKYPINLIRMDLEGYEYIILKESLPDQIETICMELHFQASYKGRVQTIKLLRHLIEQGFQETIVINDMRFGYYPIIKHFGLERTYELTTMAKGNFFRGPNVHFSDLTEFLKEIPRISIKPTVQLIMHR